MKGLTKSVMTAFIFAWVSLGVSSVAYAVTTITPGSACDLYGDTSVIRTIYKYPEGVVTGATAVGLICPIVRTDSAATAVGPVVVWLFNMGGSFSCTLVSNEWNGDLKGANTKATTAIGRKALVLYLPASASSVLSHLTVICSVPPHSRLTNIFTVR